MLVNLLRAKMDCSFLLVSLLCRISKGGMDHRLADVEGADTLRWEDQQKLSAYIEGQNYFQICKTIWSS